MNKQSMNKQSETSYVRYAIIIHGAYDYVLAVFRFKKHARQFMAIQNYDEFSIIRIGTLWI